MTIQIVGDCLAANTARMKTKAARLVGGAFPLVETGGTYVFRIETSLHPNVIVDGVDSELERKVINEVSKLVNVLLCRKEGVSSEFELRLAVPDAFTEKEQVAIGSAMSDAIVRYFHFEDLAAAVIGARPQAVPQFTHQQSPQMVEAPPWWKLW